MDSETRKYINKTVNETVTKEVNRLVEEQLKDIVENNKIERTIVSKLTQYLDGRNIQTGRTTGTTLGTAIDQKVGFHGSASIQGDTITDPTDEATLITAVTAIIDRLQDKGIIS